jgi:hypothetical protein
LYPQELSDEASKKAAEVVDKFAERLYRAGLLKEMVGLPAELWKGAWSLLGPSLPYPRRLRRWLFYLPRPSHD